MSLFLLSCAACKEKYERPDEYSEDFFKNHRKTQVRELLSPQKAFDRSAAVISNPELKAVDSGSTAAGPVYIYKITKGTLLKGDTASLVLPFHIISGTALHRNIEALYLEEVYTFKLLAEENGITLQTVPLAPAQAPN